MEPTTATGYVMTDDGLRLHFQTAGTGSRIVLVPNGMHLVDDFSRLAAGRTLVFYDVRNRGLSDAASDASQLVHGIHHDVDDIEAVRRYFGAGRIALIGHSYVGLTVVLYAMKYAERVERVIQIGAMAPGPTKQYPPHLTNQDDTLREALAGLGALEKERQNLDPEELCRRFWQVMRVIYVTNPADVDKVNWSRCHLPNERNFMKMWVGYLQPSIHQLALSPDDMASASAPVLTIHGTKDRSSPYGAGREWASRLPNARLLSVDGAGHGPWVEAPAPTFEAIETFLSGSWPEAAARVARD